MKKNKYLIKLTEKRFATSYYGGFDGDIAYDFNHKGRAYSFDSKRKALKQLKRLKKECSFDKEYQTLNVVKSNHVTKKWK